MAGYSLPEGVVVCGRAHPVHTDYRDILDILALLDVREGLQDAAFVALHLFYRDVAALPPTHMNEAYEAMSGFINCGERQSGGGGPRLIDWQQDARLIVAEVNRVAGCEVRALPHLHWHTFLAYFSCIGEGQLATVVAIRQKRARGKKLEDWEREFYRSNRVMVELRQAYGGQEEERKQLWKRLGGGGTGV